MEKSLQHLYKYYSASVSGSCKLATITKAVFANVITSDYDLTSPREIGTCHLRVTTVAYDMRLGKFNFNE
jgi:hypothetical protein